MERLRYFGTLLVLYPLAWMPFWLLYRVSDISAFLLQYVFRYRRSVIAKNLSLSFPEMSDQRRRQITRQYYRHLSDLIFETIKCLTLSPEAISKRCDIQDMHILNEYHEKKRGVVAVLGHYNNWEWAALSSALSVKQPMVVIYKPLKNEYLNRLINQTRGRFGVTMIAIKETLRFYVREKENHFVNCFVSDQSPSNGNMMHWLWFLNQLTPVSLGAEKMARRFNHAMIFVRLVKVKRGYYTVRMEKIEDQPNHLPEGVLTEKHSKLLEQQIQENPAFWIWSHKRWKRTVPESILQEKETIRQKANNLEV